jgi:hypothetical protein
VSNCSGERLEATQPKLEFQPRAKDPLNSPMHDSTIKRNYNRTRQADAKGHGRQVRDEIRSFSLPRARILLKENTILYAK